MGGLGPGIGGMEYIVIAIVALLVLGPERLPGMLHKLGKWVAKARGMANEFRASFDEMARQSELDELRKEVEALRQGQMVPLGAEADAAFKDIRDEMNRPLEGPALAAPETWPESAPMPALVKAEAEPARAKTRKAAPKPKPKPKPTAGAKSPRQSTDAGPAAPKVKNAAAKPRVSRKKAVEL